MPSNPPETARPDDLRAEAERAIACACRHDERQAHPDWNMPHLSWCPSIGPTVSIIRDLLAHLARDQQEKEQLREALKGFENAMRETADQIDAALAATQEPQP